MLITGENGTGKGSSRARCTRRRRGRRGRWSPSTPAACPRACSRASCSATCKGAFTDAKTDRVGRFELADGGTLFLDEIANVPLAQQAKLLRVLETGEFERVGSSRTRRVDVRVLRHQRRPARARWRPAASAQDLLFRLNTVEIQLPPLRERREDIPAAGRATS